MTNSERFMDGLQPIFSREVQTKALLGTREWEGGATFACPSCSELIETRDAAGQEQMPNGLRFFGVPCVCGKTFTVEIEDEASPPPEDPVANLDKRHAEELENPPEGITSEMVGRLKEVQALERQAMLDSLEEEKA